MVKGGQWLDCVFVFLFQIGASFSQTAVSIWCIDLKVSTRLHEYYSFFQALACELSHLGFVFDCLIVSIKEYTNLPEFA